MVQSDGDDDYDGNITVSDERSSFHINMTMTSDIIEKKITASLRFSRHS